MSEPRSGGPAEWMERARDLASEGEVRAARHLARLVRAHPEASEELKRDAEELLSQDEVPVPLFAWIVVLVVVALSLIAANAGESLRAISQ